MKKPKIRFKGYQEDWEQRKLGEVAKYRNGRAHENNISEGGKYVVINSKFVSTDGEVRKFSDTQIEPLYKGEIAFVLSDVPNGRAIARTFLVDKSEKYTLNQRIAGITPNENTDSYFLHILMNRNKYFLRFDDGNKQTNLSVNDVVQFEESYPSHKEQQKIGEYFAKLDHLITLHQRKCEETKTLKKYMLQKMFPQNGHSVPEIRFSGFTEDWEQRKFGDLGSVAMCKRIFKEQTTPEGEIPFYKIGTFGAIPDAFISRDLFEEYKAKFQYPNVGDMLISASGTIGRTVEYSGEEAYFQDSNIVWFKHDDRVDNSFLRCIYSIVKWDGIEGSTIKRLYNDNFLKTEFYMPTISEQIKIGTYFRILDDMITLHQRKCEELQNIKKYMLQNMFV